MVGGIRRRLTFQRLLKTVLKAGGIRNIQAVNKATEGLKRLFQRPTHVVFCDWVMDEMNGGEFTRQVRELQVPSRIILLTGFSSVDIRKRAGNLGADFFLEKPITAQALLHSIALAMENTPAD